MKLARSKQSKTTNNQNQPTSRKRQCDSFECLNTNVWAIHLITRHDVCTEWHMLPSQSYLYTHSRVAVLGLKLAHVLQPASPSHTLSPHTPASYAEWRPGVIYTDFHLLAKKPRNYRVVNTSVIMGAENLYFWLLTFVKKKKKSFQDGFYSANYLVNSQQSSISLTVRSPEV